VLLNLLIKIKKPRSEFAAGLNYSYLEYLPVIRQTQISLTKKESGKAKAKEKSILSCDLSVIHVKSPN